LRHGEDLAFDVKQRKIHFRLRIFKNAQIKNFLRQYGDIAVLIRMAEAGENTQTGGNLADHFA
jgi:hypothetical protein